MSRQENVSVVESFFDAIIRGDLDRLPLDPEIVFQSPLISETKGRAAATTYLAAVAAAVKSIRVLQHIVEGDHVATLFEEETAAGPLRVFAKFEIVSGRIKDVRVFYDPRRMTGSG